MNKFKAISPEMMIASVSLSEFSLSLQQMLIVHDLIKSNLLRDGVYTAHLQNKDQLVISMEDGDWATVGKLKVVTICFGDYSPGMADDDVVPGDQWYASGTRYFAADDSGVDDAIMIFMGKLFSNTGEEAKHNTIVPTYLEFIEEKYRFNASSQAEAEANFSHIIKKQ